MKTKVTVLGGSEIEQPEKKQIVFIRQLAENEIVPSALSPAMFSNIELLCRNYDGYDLIFAFDEDRDKGVLYLGHFNDGIV